MLIYHINKEKLTTFPNWDKPKPKLRVGTTPHKIIDRERLYVCIRAKLVSRESKHENGRKLGVILIA